MRPLAGLLGLLLLLTSCVLPSQVPPEPTPPTTESEEVSVMDLHEKVNQLEAMRDLDEIFALEDDTDFGIALSSALCDWTNYGETLDVLSPEAQVFYLCDMLEMQVNCDGFSGFIFERYGAYAHETVDALEAIGAPKTADILRRVIATLPNGVCPKDYHEREEILFTDFDGYMELFNSFDDEFYGYPDGPPLSSICLLRPGPPGMFFRSGRLKDWRSWNEVK